MPFKINRTGPLRGFCEARNHRSPIKHIFEDRGDGIGHDTPLCGEGKVTGRQWKNATPYSYLCSVCREEFEALVPNPEPYPVSNVVSMTSYWDTPEDAIECLQEVLDLVVVEESRAHNPNTGELELVNCRLETNTGVKLANFSISGLSSSRWRVGMAQYCVWEALNQAGFRHREIS